MSDGIIEHIKIFSFKSVNDITGEDITLDVSIPEKVQATYSSYTWPSAPVLAWYLWEKRKDLVGKHILEIGAGTALPGILAAKCGAYVTLSENALLPKSIESLIHSCELNNLSSSQVQVIGLTWGIFSSSLFKLGSLDYIIGSDCFYEPQIFEDIIVTVAYLLEKNPCAKFWTVYQERSADWSIEHLLNKWNLICETISLENLGSKSELNASELTQDHTIHLLEITRKS